MKLQRLKKMMLTATVNCVIFSSTNFRAIHCVAALTYQFLLLRASVFNNIIFREPQSSHRPFITHQMFMCTFQVPVQDCIFRTNTPFPVQFKLNVLCNNQNIPLDGYRNKLKLKEIFVATETNFVRNNLVKYNPTSSRVTR